MSYSRVKRVGALLLFRAFSLLLFQQGSMPGPHVLLKWLRCRLGPESSTYTLADAKREYEQAMQTHEEGRKARRETGITWSCCMCDLAFPAAGFNVNTGREDEVRQLCAGAGHWRACKACKNHMFHHEAIPAAERQAEKMKRCVSCEKQRPHTFFKAESDECDACALLSSLVGKTCAGCQKVLPRGKLRVAASGKGYTCAKCSPNTWEYKCTVCGLDKNVADFRAKPAELQKSHIRRCVACEKCADCGLTFKDYRAFATNADKCNDCYYRANAAKKCEVCLETKAAAEFSVGQWHNASKIEVLCCKGCHTCTDCGEAKDARAFGGVARVCKTCTAARRWCDVCEETKSRRRIQLEPIA